MVPLMATDEEIEELDDDAEDDGESNEETHEVKACTMDSLAHNKCPVYWSVLIFKPIWYLQQCPLYTECPQ